MRQSDNPKASQVSATRGRPFANGNPGRKPGSKNRTTLVAAALLDGEAEELVRKAVELAKAGDAVMLKFLLGRILPRERLIKLDLPHMDFADDAVEALPLPGSASPVAVCSSAMASTPLAAWPRSPCLPSRYNEM
jgi:hypothetical protein